MRMTTRGIGLAAAALSLVLAASACGGAAEDDDGGGGKAGAPGNTAGFDGKTIKLGVITPLSGPVAVIGKPLTSGNEVWFKALNAKGGIGGKYKVELAEEDSQYKTDVAVQKYNKIKSDVVAFTQVLGTPSTLAVLPQLRTDKILAAPASLDAFWVREDNLLPVGGPYQVQAINAVDYYLTDGGGSKDDVICTMIQDDVYGEAGQQGIDFAAEKYGFSVANTQKFKQGTENYAGQIGALAGAKCQMVFLVATPSDAAKIWGTAAQARFAPQWFGQSPSYTGALAASAIAPYMQQSVLIVAEGTEWGDESVPGMKEMVDAQGTYAPEEKPDYYFAFGYNQGARDDRGAGEGRGERRPVPRGHPQGLHGDRHGQLRGAVRRLPVRARRGAQPAPREHHLQDRPGQAVRPGEGQVPPRIRCRQGVRVQEGGSLITNSRIFSPAG